MVLRLDDRSQKENKREIQVVDAFWVIADCALVEFGVRAVAVGGGVVVILG